MEGINSRTSTGGAAHTASQHPASSTPSAPTRGSAPTRRFATWASPPPLSPIIGNAPAPSWIQQPPSSRINVRAGSPRISKNSTAASHLPSSTPGAAKAAKELHEIVVVKAETIKQLEELINIEEMIKKQSEKKSDGVDDELIKERDEQIQSLKGKGIKIDALSYSKNTMLREEAEKDQADFLKEFKNARNDAITQILKKNIDINKLTLEEKTALLHTAAKEGQIGIVKLMPQEFLKSTSNGEAKVFSPLHFAAGNGHLDIVEYLDKSGVDLNIQRRKQTPLDSAVLAGHSEIVKYLLDKKVEITSNNILKRNALHHAVNIDMESINENRINIINMLLQNNADMNAKDIDGRTPIDIAETKGLSYLMNASPNKSASTHQIASTQSNIMDPGGHTRPEIITGQASVPPLVERTAAPYSYATSSSNMYTAQQPRRNRNRPEVYAPPIEHQPQTQFNGVDSRSFPQTASYNEVPIRQPRRYLNRSEVYAPPIEHQPQMQFNGVDSRSFPQTASYNEVPIRQPRRNRNRSEVYAPPIEHQPQMQFNGVDSRSFPQTASYNQGPIPQQAYPNRYQPSFNPNSVGSQSYAPPIPPRPYNQGQTPAYAPKTQYNPSKKQ